MSLPPVDIPLGAMRFNSDSAKLEYFDGNAWFQVHTFNPNLQGGARGLVSSGTFYNTIEYITISTRGNGTDFGDLQVRTMLTSGCSSRTRSCVMGGRLHPSGSPQTNRIEYVEFSTTGNGTDFGDLTKTNDYGSIGQLGNQTRGMVSGGTNYAPATDMGVDISCITMATTGNAFKFGETAVNHLYSAGTFSSSTRGVIAGGGNPGLNTMEYITIHTEGNARDFGDLEFGLQGSTGVGNSVLGFTGGGYDGADRVYIQKVNIATTGNSTYFGDITDSRRWPCGMSDSIRAVFAGGYAPGYSNVMDCKTFATEGNAFDFGDLTESKGGSTGTSNAHGGLQ